MSSQQQQEEPSTPTTPSTPSSATTSDENVFLVESLPRGFHTTVEIINILPEPLVNEMAYKILANITGNNNNNNNNNSSNNKNTYTTQLGGLDVDELVQKLKFDLKFDLQQILFKEQLLAQKIRTQLQRDQINDEQDLIERSVGQEIQNVLNCITYVYKSALRNRVNSSNFAKCIRRQTQMNVNIIKLLQQHYHNHLDTNESSNNKTFHLQRLKSMDWKLSVSMASFCCEQLNDAKVTLVFTLNNKSSNETLQGSTKHSVELSLEEFRQFYSSFADMANLITTL